MVSIRYFGQIRNSGGAAPKPRGNVPAALTVNYV